MATGCPVIIQKEKQGKFGFKENAGYLSTCANISYLNQMASFKNNRSFSQT